MFSTKEFSSELSPVFTWQSFGQERLLFQQVSLRFNCTALTIEKTHHCSVNQLLEVYSGFVFFFIWRQKPQLCVPTILLFSHVTAYRAAKSAPSWCFSQHGPTLWVKQSNILFCLGKPFFKLWPKQGTEDTDTIRMIEKSRLEILSFWLRWDEMRRGKALDWSLQRMQMKKSF